MLSRLYLYLKHVSQIWKFFRVGQDQLNSFCELAIHKVCKAVLLSFFPFGSSVTFFVHVNLITNNISVLPWQDTWGWDSKVSYNHLITIKECLLFLLISDSCIANWIGYIPCFYLNLSWLKAEVALMVLYLSAHLEEKRIGKKAAFNNFICHF